MQKSLMKRIVLLMVSVIINGFAVSVYVKSAMGVSTISSIPLILSNRIPELSLGMASILFQALLIIILLVMVGRKKSYLVSMGLGLVFGTIVDLWDLLWAVVPLDVIPGIILYIIAFFSLAFGIGLALSSNLTALPFDIFTKDLAEKLGKTVKIVKTVFDVVCVIVAVGLSLIFFGNIQGIGVGTFASMLFTGTVVHFFHSRISTAFQHQSQTTINEQ